MHPRFNLKIADYIGSPEKKKYYNEQHFTEAASRYDWATRAMSLGRDGAWKRALVQSLPRFDAPACVDLACGTGDVSFLLAGRYPRGRVLGLDLTESMLEIARRRNRFDAVCFECRDMCCTGLADASADIVTGSYALRNAPDFHQALEEMRRILRPGGTLALLDFAKPTGPLAQGLQFHLLQKWCGFWGLVFHGNPEIHSYIAASLRSFPDGSQLQAMLQRHGFEGETRRSFFAGMMELRLLRKKA